MMVLLLLGPTITLLTTTVAAQSANVSDQLDTMVRRSRREPAIWGDPAPSYHLAVLDDVVRLLHCLLFVDAKIASHYQHDMVKIKREVIKTVEEANSYFYQINIRIVVVDILQTQRSDLSLYTFEEYRNSRVDILPAHDFAALLAYRYAGGLAFVSAMCTPKSVMLCGFYPHNPLAMGSIFFHEVSHLLGVAHMPENETLIVENCACDQLENTEQDKEGCLKIPGFDHDCTLQHLANLLGRSRCLRELRTPEQSIVKSSVGICGNGILELGEECDCGLVARCANWNCRARECRKHFADWIIGSITIVLLISLVSPVIYYLYHVYMLSLFPEKVSRSLKLCSLVSWLCSTSSSNQSPDRPLTRLKRRLSGRPDFNYPIRCRANYKYGQLNRCLRRDLELGLGKEPNERYSIAPAFVGDEKRCTPVKLSTTRPSRPPPPPPPLRNKYRTRCNCSKKRCRRCPALFNEYETPNSLRGMPQATTSSTALDSISHKFDEFDLDDESSCEETGPIIVYTPAMNKNQRVLDEDSRCLLELSSSSSSGENLVSSSTTQASSSSQKRLVEEMIKRFNAS